jgi:hypothetical protein
MKLVAAFLAGLIIACFAALIYVKETRPAGAPPAPVTASTPSPQPDQTAKAESPPETPAPVDDSDAAETRPAQHAPARPPVAKPVHRELHHAVHPPPTPLEQPTEAAKNEPPPAADPAPVSDAAQPAVTPAPQQQDQPAVTVAPTPAPPPPPPVRQPMTVTLASGMAVPIRLGETLSTDNNYTGDTFRATLEQPIIMNGYIIADKGSKVLGRIVEADKPGRVKGAGELILALTEINTTDGQRVAIHTESWAKEAPNSHRRDAAEIGGGAALGAIIGALAGGGKGAAIGAGAGGAAGAGVDMATRGKPAVVPVETHLTFHLQNPVTITEKLN